MSGPQKADLSVVGTHVSCLPPEVMMKIFVRLNKLSKGRVARVCMDWRNIVCSSSLWCDDCYEWDHCEREKPWMTPLITGLGITRVKIPCQLKVLNDLDRSPWCDLPLRSLELSDFNFDPYTVCTMFMRRPFPDLTELILHGCNNISDRDLNIMFRNLPNLTSLEVYDCRTLKDISIDLIAIALPKLKSLSVSFVMDREDSGFSDKSIGYICGRGSVNLNEIPKLELLHLWNCGTMSNLSMQYLLTGQRNLKTLVLNEYEELDESGIADLAMLPCLEKLVLGSCQSVTDEAVLLLAAMPSLRDLELRDCYFTDESLTYLADGGSRITTLNICPGPSDFPGVLTDLGLKQLARLTHLQNLTIDDLYESSFVSNQGFTYLAQGVAKITTLDISGCDRLGAETVVHISKCMTLLRELSVESKQINDLAMASCARNLPNLVTLLVNFRNKIAEARELRDRC